MPELQLSISFPNLTADGYPVLYPIGWSSSDVSIGWFSIIGCLSLLFLFKISLKKFHLHLLIYFVWGVGLHVPWCTEEVREQLVVVSSPTIWVGPAVW